MVRSDIMYKSSKSNFDLIKLNSKKISKKILVLDFHTDNSLVQDASASKENNKAYYHDIIALLSKKKMYILLYEVKTISG